MKLSKGFFLSSALTLLLTGSITLIIIHYIGTSTLLNVNWLNNYYEDKYYYEQMYQIIHSSINQSISENGGDNVTVKDIVTIEEVKHLFTIRTEQIVAYDTNKMLPLNQMGLDEFIERLNNELDQYVFTDVQKETIINNFKVKMNGHFFTILKESQFEPTVKSKAADFIIFANNNNHFQMALFSCVISLVGLVIYHCRQLVILFLNLSHTVVLTGLMLFLSFIMAHDLYYDRLTHSIVDIKYQMAFTLYNEVFKYLYTIGYYLVIIGIILRFLVFWYRTVCTSCVETEIE